jgi:DNA primase
MDPVAEIKSRLPIEELVGRYAQLQKKGRNFVCLCPFHQDSHPSFLVSPDKGIAYCFACQNGGDIFSVYQKLENVDFVQALKDLAERTGVKLPDRPTSSGPKKEEKDRMKDCLEAAAMFYNKKLQETPKALEYLKARGVPAEQIQEFGLGVAPDAWSELYDAFLKQGYSRSELINAGLAVQSEVGGGKTYDRFRNRLMFPITDAQGVVIGFGGRTLGNDDAKYINSSESAVYKKSQVLFGLYHARDAIRESRSVILVEGYFDVLACHRIGIKNVVATSGTALTEEHAKILRRLADSVTLCLDSDRAGKDAAERAFFILCREKLAVQSIVLTSKDPGDAVNDDPLELKRMLTEGSRSYVENVLTELSQQDLSSSLVRREALLRLLPLIQAIPFSVERDAAITKASAALGTSETALRDDLMRAPKALSVGGTAAPAQHESSMFSTIETVLGMFLCNPLCLPLLNQLIEPTTDFAKALYNALKALPAELQYLDVQTLDLSPEHRERASILFLLSEQHGFSEWSQSLAQREIRKHCVLANRELLKEKQQEITKKLLKARTENNREEELLLTNEYQEIIKLQKMAA